MKRSILKAAFIAALFSLFFIMPINAAASSDIEIIEAQAWIESAYITWQPVADAATYNVYYSGEGISNKKIDTQLIRNYGSYFRADIVGLKAGEYKITVKAVDENEAEYTVIESPILNVLPHDRTGFAFANGRTPGAYKADGTPKEGAVILYITEKTKNTVSLEVNGANANPCVGLFPILEGFKKGKDERPLIIRLIGQVTDPAEMDKGDIVIENKNNEKSYITFEGIGEDAVADGWGIRLKNATNIEVRNLGLMNCDSDEGDNIGLQQGNDYVWIHHCDFFYGHAGSDADQAKGDGALDCKKSNYVTFSYNHFWDTGKSNLLGLSGENDKMYITYHHNWYDHSDSRHPRVRSYSAHVYNNYYDGIAKYGVGATLGSSVFVEGNYFRNCKYPILTSMQGSDVWDESKQVNEYKNKPTFSKEDGGSIKAFNNYMEGQARFVAYGAEGYPLPTTVDFDAYVVASRQEQVPAVVQSVYGKNTYNNFDTDPSILYSYTPDSPEQAREKVMTYAGRINGGDFKWVFNNEVDDTSYDINVALKTALLGYKTSLVFIQGDGDGGGEPGGEEPGGEEPGELPEGGYQFIPDKSINTSNYFVASTSTSKNGGVHDFGEMSLSSGLKMDSKGSIEFTTTTDNASMSMGMIGKDAASELKLMFGAEETSLGVIGTTYTEKKISLKEKGTYRIVQKAKESYVYYLIVEEEDSNSSIQSHNTSRLQVYPNPVVHSVTINSDAIIKSIELYSITGQRLSSISGNVRTLNMSAYAAGTYYIKVITEKEIQGQWLIKK